MGYVSILDFVVEKQKRKTIKHFLAHILLIVLVSFFHNIHKKKRQYGQPNHTPLLAKLQPQAPLCTTHSTPTTTTTTTTRTPTIKLYVII